MNTKLILDDFGFPALLVFFAGISYVIIKLMYIIEGNQRFLLEKRGYTSVYRPVIEKRKYSHEEIRSMAEEISSLEEDINHLRSDDWKSFVMRNDRRATYSTSNQYLNDSRYFLMRDRELRLSLIKSKFQYAVKNKK